jgi:NADH-quinone oxidoreductase subunit H
MSGGWPPPEPALSWIAAGAPSALSPQPSALPLWSDVLLVVVKIVIVMFAVMTAMAYLTYFERKVLARMQSRYGPNRAGPFGLLQPLADAVKLISKEDVIPAAADKAVFYLAPVMIFVPALLAWAVIPFGEPLRIGDAVIPLQITELNVGVLYVLALGSIGVYGVVMAGWASNNKYALLGGLRSSSQVISYEVSLGLGLMGVLMLARSMDLNQIVDAQRWPHAWLGVIPGWYVFVQPLGFLIYLTSAIAETNRAPFDLPEAETELVAGFHVEYSAFRFALFFLAEYINMLVVSALATVLFFGGYAAPFGLADGVWWFVAKMAVFIFVYYWLRATLPRLRYDQLMALCWKVLLPLALLNILVTGTILVVTRG